MRTYHLRKKKQKKKKKKSDSLCQLLYACNHCTTLILMEYLLSRRYFVLVQSKDITNISYVILIEFYCEES